MLLAIASTVILGFESDRTHDHRLLSEPLTQIQVKLGVTLRLAVYRQSVRLSAQPLETHDQSFFFQLNPCGHSPYVTSSLTRSWMTQVASTALAMNRAFGSCPVESVDPPPPGASGGSPSL
jgi:hypothetical protein